MRALGLTVAIAKQGRPVVRAVLLEDPHGPGQVPLLADVSRANEFDLPTAETEWALICRQLHRDVSARVTSLDLDIVVVRRADFHRSQGNNDGPKLRLAVEGAIVAAAADHVASTHLRTGQACADKYGKTKNEMDNDGKSVVSKAYQGEAAAAALSGLFGNRT